MASGATANSAGSRSRGRGVADGLEADVARLVDELSLVLRRTVDLGWARLLEDRGRLSELSERLRAAAPAGGGRAGARGAATPADFAGLVEALALMDGRLQDLEKRLRVLAEVTSTVASALEQMRARPGRSAPEGTAESPGGAGGA